MNIENFLNTPYPLIVNETTSKVFIFVPKLFIHVEGDSLAKTFELCRQEKVNFYKRLELVDALHLIPSASDFTPIKRRFVIQKIIIERAFSFLVALFFGLIFVVLIFLALNKAVKKLDSAFTPVSDEKKEVRLQRFKEKLHVASPYIKEIKKVFNE